jgi:hypothetical protein
MTEEQLESLRREAIRQLEQEQQQRDAKRADLQKQARELEAADSSAAGCVLRARQPFTDASKCPLCWIWRGELVNLTAVASESDDWDRFSCPTGHKFEFPTA